MDTSPATRLAQHNGHETFAAIREANDTRGRSLHAFHGTVRCLCIAGEVASCGHMHKTRSKASECAEGMCPPPATA